MVVYFLYEFFVLGFDGVPVYFLQDVVGLPAAAFHDILVGNPDGVHDGSRIMPEVVKTEMRNACLLQKESKFF